jgi:stage IV sporulation protein FB
MDAFHLFSFRGIPVRASIWFFVLIGYYAFALGRAGPEVMIAWLVAVTVSLLVHEFGHAFVARHFRLSPEVVLHGWGGLCAHQPARRDRDDALIIAAGPAAGLAFAAVCELIRALLPETATQSRFLLALFEFLWLVNFWWSLVNLLPLFPLDGGQLFRLGMRRIVKPVVKADRIVHAVGIAVALGGIVWAISSGSTFLGILAGLLLFQNVVMLNEGGGGGAPRRGASPHVDALLSQAVTAFETGDAREARRLAYQAREEPHVDERQLERIYELVVVTSAALEDWTEALDWDKRAPRTPGTQAARILALIHIGRIAEARHELESPYAAKLSEQMRKQIEAALVSADRSVSR